MRKLLASFFFAFLSAAAIISLACGSSHNGLQTLTIAPAAEDAKTYPNGEVQFTAMGTYSGSIHPVAVEALWWSFTPWTTPPPAPSASGLPPTPPTFSLDSTGLAICQGTGTFTLWATAPADQSLSLSAMTKSTAQVSATAQLTCP